MSYGETAMQENYSKLLTYSYNIVGSYEDAKDLVQDVIEKYISLDKSSIRDEYNYLVKSTINHSINFKNRQTKKEIFGEWLPEPVSFESPDIKLIKEQTAGYTMMVLLEKLNPKERAVFILKEGFDYQHAEIGELLDITQENSRQLLSRANKTLNDAKFQPRKPTSIQLETLKKYQMVLCDANITELEKLLVTDVKLTADGGKQIRVVKAIEIGVANTATLLSYVQHQFLSNKEFSLHNLNHQPCICFWENQRLYNCHILDIDSNGRIQNIFSIVDPTKLKNLHKLSRS